ncbi:PAS domain-containing protein [Sphingomonas sp. LY160]|uniref:PAS domain-containing protein n=1 Tax=Sphingomonas sp. LY160 TaxID=3095342 RepID=UPI002ADEF864|nr:PAS domain-containing protein [Sphingomonas sp. LY160]MEA1072677.1 PAS domain-containing protein [Sphingomonas sp. LY160]
MPTLPDAAFDFSAILSIADAIPVMIAYIDRQERYRFVNRALADWLEQPRSVILGKSVKDVLGSDAYRARKPMIDAAFAGEPQKFSREFEHPSRGRLTAQTSYIPQLSPDGIVGGVVMLVEDVTEQREAVTALKESEARFRRIADSAPVPMWVTRLDRTRDFVNAAYVELMGTTPKEARTIEWSERIHPDDHARMIRETLAGEATGKTYTLEARFRVPSGEYRWMQATSQPRRDGEGKLIGYIGVATDITVTKEAELELRRLVDARTVELTASEGRLRSIFDTVREVVVLTAPDGTVLQMNRTNAEWRDPEPTKAIGDKIWDAPTLKAFPHHQQLMRDAVAAAAAGEDFEREVKLEKEGMTTAYLDVSLRPVRNSAGTIEYLLFEARDITELKAAQDQLRQSQKMEALGQLTGGIAHDFNNLLTVVVGGLDMIAKQVEGERLQRYANNALAAAERGARLTAQLLTFSRVQRLEVRPTYVGPLIEEMRPLLRNVLGPGIAKKFKLEKNYLPVMADPTQLEVAVLNVAINARDAMPAGGTLTFATEKVNIADDPELADGEYVQLSISDTGEGMPPEVVARAFEPFFTTKDVGKGTGLGLAMVYGMARQSGGTARIDSEPGLGTTVRLLFRRAEQDGVVPASGGRTGDALRREQAAKSVLVIDDDDDVRGFVVEALEELGHTVASAADGAAGLELFDRFKPDLVVLDFVMPGMSGAEVARELLSRRPGQPILFVSGFSETDAIRAAAPSALILAKPFRPAALEAAMNDVLASA